MTNALTIKGDYQYDTAAKTEKAVKTTTTAKLGAKLSAFKEKITSPRSTPNPSQTQLPLEVTGRLDDRLEQPFALKDLDVQVPRGECVQSIR